VIPIITTAQRKCYFGKPSYGLVAHRRRAYAVSRKHMKALSEPDFKLLQTSSILQHFDTVAITARVVH